MLCIQAPQDPCAMCPCTTVLTMYRGVLDVELSEVPEVGRICIDLSHQFLFVGVLKYVVTVQSKTNPSPKLLVCIVPGYPGTRSGNLTNGIFGKNQIENNLHQSWIQARLLGCSRGRKQNQGCGGAHCQRASVSSMHKDIGILQVPRYPSQKETCT